MTNRYRIRCESGQDEPIWVVDAWVRNSYGQHYWQTICAYTCERDAKAFTKGENVTEPKLTKNQEALMDFICDTFNISRKDVLGIRRTKHASLPRFAFMYFCSTALKMSLKPIGKSIRRDHTSVMHGISRVFEATDKDFLDKLLRIENFCTHRFPRIPDKRVQKYDAPTIAERVDTEEAPFNFWKDNIDEPRYTGATRANVRASTRERAAI